MKKLVVLIAVVLCTQLSYSQVFVEDQNINELDIRYVQLVGVNTSMFGKKMKIYVDYGQKAKFMIADGIKSTNGEKKRFNSMIDALNFMNKNGWKYVNYTEAIYGSKLRYIYLLEKE